jgi:hypothetical protein
VPVAGFFGREADTAKPFVPAYQACSAPTLEDGQASRREQAQGLLATEHLPATSVGAAATPIAPLAATISD